MSIEIRHLRAFAATARESHFGRAADRLHITQPALSRTIRQLELALGGTLFDRTTRSVRLTPLGELFRERAAEALQHFDAAIAAAERAARGATRRIVVGHTEVAVFGLLPRILRAFAAAHPEVEVALEPGFTALSLARLKAGELDLAFVTGRTEDPELDCLPLWEEPSVAVLAQAHPLARRRVVALRDLRAEAFVLGPRASWMSYRPLVEAACARAGFAPRVVAEADSSSAIVQLVAGNDAVTVHPECVRNIAGRGVAIRELRDPGLGILTCLALRRDRASPPARRFAALAREVCGASQPAAARRRGSGGGIAASSSRV